MSSADLLIANLVPGNTGYSNTISVDVTTNSATGYTLSAKVGDGTTYTNDRLVSSTGSYFTNRASSATLSNFNANEWGYTLASAIIDSTTYGGLIYNTDTTINATTNAAGAAATGYSGGNSTSFTIGAKADATQTTGDYKNVIIFTVVSNPVSTTYSIAYNTNTTDGVRNMPNNVNNVGTASSSITLSSAVPVRNIYEFKGWCTAQVSDNATCSGTEYAPSATYQLTAGQANNITLYARWASICPANSICYMPNPGVSGIEGSMASLGTTTVLTAVSAQAGKQSVSANSTAELIAPNFKRSGYGFAGWSTDSQTTNSSTIYGPNETISTNPSSGGVDVSNGLILYPVWVASAGNIQIWGGCNNLTAAPTNTRATLSSITALTDMRDNNTYAVARLADGKCWMIENLRLDNTATITVSNTHNPLHDSNGVVTLKTNYANNTIANHLVATSNSWCTDTNAACFDQTMLNTNNTRLSDSSLTASYNGNDATSKWYSYGDYYNWYSATAGNGTYSFSTNNNSVDGDICPTGWHLPKGGDKNNTTNSEFWALSLAIVGTEPANTSSTTYPNYTGDPDGINASKIFRAYPNNFVYSGGWTGVQTSNRSSYGLYWSSSANADYHAYSFFFNSSSVYPGAILSSKCYGLSVRCVAGNGMHSGGSN